MRNSFAIESKNVFKEAARNIMEVANTEVIISVSRECIDNLEKNKTFAEATKEGLSRETLRNSIVPAFNYLISNLNLEKFNTSTTMQLIRGAVYEELDLTSFSGEDIFDIMDSEGLFAEIYKPEFKKQLIFNEAIELVAQKGNISFNEAIERTIEEMKSETYSTRQLEKSEILSNRIASSINLIVEFYLEHETEIILAIMMKKK